MPGFKKKNILEDQSLLATAMDHPQDETQPKTWTWGIGLYLKPTQMYLLYEYAYTCVYILGADDTGLCGQFSRCFLAHDMGFMYRFCYGFFFTLDMGVMRRPNGQVFFHFIDRWHGNKWSNLHMTWDFQEDTDVQDGKWQVNSFKF